MSTDGVLSLGECSVCMETILDPKTLECQHSYCKECLEGLLEIVGEKVTLKCPMCQRIQEFPEERTVSDLDPPLILKQVLDAIPDYHSRCSEHARRSSEAEKKLNPRCMSEDTSCSATDPSEHVGVMEWYCVSCQSFFCEKCLNLHSLLSNCGTSSDWKFYQVKYNESSDSFVMYCGKHRSFHRYGCDSCSKTFCTYCLARSHPTESCISCRDSDQEGSTHVLPMNSYVAQYKNPLLETIEAKKQLIQKQESVVQEMNNTSLKSQQIMTDFQKFIEERKISVLSQILFFLEMTGKQVMASFKKEHSKYEDIKEKLKQNVESELVLTKEILTKSECILNSSVVELIHAQLPSEEHKPLITSFPSFFNMGGTMDIDEVNRNVLAAGVRASFGNVNISTVGEDGETVEEVLTFDNTFDYSPGWISKLNDISESKQYAMKCLKKMGLDVGQMTGEQSCKETIANDKNEDVMTQVTEATAKMTLNDIINKKKWAKASYKTTKVEDSFMSVCCVNAVDYTGEICPSKKEAEQNAARVALNSITLEQPSESHIEAEESRQEESAENLMEEEVEDADVPPLGQGVTSDSQINNDPGAKSKRSRRKNRGGSKKGCGTPTMERKDSVSSECSNSSSVSYHQDFFSSECSNSSGVSYYQDFFSSIPCPESYVLETPNTEADSGRGRGQGRGRGNDNRGRGNDKRGCGNDKRGRGSDNRGRGNDNRGRGNDNRGRGNDNRGRGNDNRGRGNDNRGRGNDNRGRGNDTRGRGGNNRGRGDGILGRGDGHRGGTRGRGRGGGPRGVPHLRPTAASSMGSLSQCYKCGEMGHLVSECSS